MVKNKEPSKKKVKPKATRPQGRPTSYKPEYDELAFNYCLLGATDVDMAKFFGVSEQTLNSWKQNHVSFLESLKRGKEDADALIASKLFHRAKGYTHKELITASFQGQITDTMEVDKHYPPDTTAAIFWLKNRNPKMWRDKQDVELSGQVNVITVKPPVFEE